MAAMVAQPLESAYDATRSPMKSSEQPAVRPTKLFVGGISSNTTTKVLREHFSEYCQVLDCVAMRTPDGRSRGFGLVTLDSLSVAETILSVPQVIDGRVVDIKMAVPDSRAKSTVQKIPSGQSQAGQWQSSKRAAPAKSPVALSATAPEFVFRKAPAALSADAAEFVPKCALAPVAQVRAARRLDDEDVLVFAEDYVAFLEDQQHICLTKKDTNKPLSPPPAQAPPSPPVALAVVEVGQLEKQNRIDSFDGYETSSSTAAGGADSEAESESRSSEDSSAISSASAEDLTTKGSALHSSGGCKPCNFFPKGRCASGVDCVFCHLPHAVRKPTRQEKRERLAAWQARQMETAQCKTANSNNVNGKQDVDCLSAAGAPPGLECSPALMAAVQGRKLPASCSQPVRTSAAGPERQMTTQAPVSLALNFAGYDDSDDDSEMESEPLVANASAIETVESGHRWSREEMLRLRVAMGAAKAACAADVSLPFVQ